VNWIVMLALCGGLRLFLKIVCRNWHTSG
jgi:hypothetical protein